MKKRAKMKRKKKDSRNGRDTGRMTGAGIVLLDPDVAEAFPDAKSVNRALRAIVAIAPAKRRGR
jgi:hypothetical protein